MYCPVYKLVVTVFTTAFLAKTTVFPALGNLGGPVSLDFDAELKDGAERSWLRGTWVAEVGLWLHCPGSVWDWSALALSPGAFRPTCVWGWT